MFRFAAFVAVCLMASAEALAQDAPPPAPTHARPWQLTDASIEARIAQVVRTHLQRCWRSTADLGPHVSVTLAFTLNQDGSLASAPQVRSPRGWLTRDQREGARRAVEAVHSCDPFPLASDAELGAHYDIWREQEVTFAIRSQPRGRMPPTHPPAS